MLVMTVVLHRYKGGEKQDKEPCLERQREG